MTEFQLATERLILRDWRESDFEQYFKHCETEKVMRYLGKPRSKRAVRDEIADFQAQREVHGFNYWVMERKSDGEFLGFCGLDVLDYVDPPCTVINELEIGWRLRADEWKKGYATEAAQAALAYAFEELLARRVVSRVDKYNRESAALMRRLGMRHEYVLDYRDGKNGPLTHVYTLAWQEWASRNQPRA